MCAFQSCAPYLGFHYCLDLIDSTSRSYKTVKVDKLIVDLSFLGSDNVLQYFLMKLKLIFLISLSNRR
ncbi:uncharacterized protein METZ01_LOCUS79257 [marine metagenome]|uniref:Uncharacterized protein n=1 Tax=marine metagenome TaxID=408172 RepID=A0A381UI52_9ZZZZ